MHWTQDPDRKKAGLEKRKQTNLEKYGVEFVMSDPEIKKKVSDKLKRVFSECPDIDLFKCILNEGCTRDQILSIWPEYDKKTLSHWAKELNVIFSSKYYRNADPPKRPEREILEELYKTKSMITIAEQYGVTSPTMKKWFIEYNIPIRTRSDSTKLCIPNVAQSKLEKYGYSYFPPDLKYKRSKAEIELQDYLNSFGCDFKSNRKILSGNLELDLYDENLNLAIEYNGDWYHSELFKESNYHYNKWKECQDKGIQLIHIFDSEYKKRELQFKSYLKTKCGIYDKRIYARNCEVKEITSPREFLNKNHIQGEPRNYLKSYGLYFNGELLGVVIYSKHHRNNSSDIVLSRLAFKSGIQIIGGASKLIKNSLKESGFSSVVTWSDNRLSTGKVYDKSGFILEKMYKPDYFYTSNKGNFSKQSQQKKKTNCPEHMTEYQWANERGLYRIFDCGKKKWKWTK